MSRYTAKLPSGSTLAWGYDKPLSEYFIQIHNDNDETLDETEGVLFAISNYYTMVTHPDYPHKIHYSNSELLKVYLEYKEYIPKEHIENLMLDLPF